MDIVFCGGKKMVRQNRLRLDFVRIHNGGNAFQRRQYLSLLPFLKFLHLSDKILLQKGWHGLDRLAPLFRYLHEYLTPVLFASNPLHKISGLKPVYDARNSGIAEAGKFGKIAEGQARVTLDFPQKDHLRDSQMMALNQLFGVQVDGPHDAAQCDQHIVEDLLFWKKCIFHFLYKYFVYKVLAAGENRVKHFQPRKGSEQCWIKHEDPHRTTGKPLKQLLPEWSPAVRPAGGGGIRPTPAISISPPCISTRLVYCKEARVLW